jgi:hypothetical protein
VTSRPLPTYARVDLAFDRGEGAWLVSAAGGRHRRLGFGGGVATAAIERIDRAAMRIEGAAARAQMMKEGAAE